MKLRHLLPILNTLFLALVAGVFVHSHGGVKGDYTYLGSVTDAPTEPGDYGRVFFNRWQFYGDRETALTQSFLFANIPGFGAAKAALWILRNTFEEFQTSYPFGLSYASYSLMLGFPFSLLQWFGIGALLDWLRRRSAPAPIALTVMMIAFSACAGTATATTSTQAGRQTECGYGSSPSEMAMTPVVEPTTTARVILTGPCEFTGKERDDETGLDFMEARYFSGAQGRFTSVDPDNAGSNPFDPQSWNGYAYGRNNPLLYTDPTGTNYTVCDVQGNNCRNLSDQQYGDYRSSSPSVYQTPGGTLYSRNDGGPDTKIGSATYYNEKKQASDIQGAQFLYNQTGPVVKGVATVALAFVAAAGMVAAAPAAAAMPAFVPQIANFAGKQAAKAAIQGMGLPAAQAAAAISAIARATSSSSIQILKQGQEIVVRIARAGANGYQVIESVIDQGGSKQVVQKAFDATNTLVHYDPKK